MSKGSAETRAFSIAALVSVALASSFVPCSASAFGAFGKVLYSPWLYTDHATDINGDDYTYTTLDWIIDPSAIDVTGFTISIAFDPTKYKFDQALSGPFGAFSVGGDAPVQPGGVGTEPLLRLPATGFTPGAPLPGSSLVYTVSPGLVTVDYQFPTTPVSVSGDVNNFSVDFDLIHPARIDGATATVTYLPVGAGVDFTQMPGTCTTTTGAGVCGSDDAISGITLNQTFVPEPGSWVMILAGFGGLGAALRSGRRQSATVR